MGAQQEVLVTLYSHWADSQHQGDAIQQFEKFATLSEGGSS